VPPKKIVPPCSGATALRHFILACFMAHSGFPVTLPDLGDLPDRKYFYQWNSEKRK
jgi:hypothetical protein